MKKLAAPVLGLVAAFAFSAVSAHAAEADEIAVDLPVDVKEPAVDPVVDVAVEEPVEITRAGDDGVIGETERNLDDANPVDNPDVIFYTMGPGGFDPVDSIAETAAEQAAQQVADRVEERAVETPATPAPVASLR